MLYLDHSGVSVTIDRDHKELQISNASKGSHHGFHHVVQDLMMHFSSLAELDKWYAALTNCLHPQPEKQHAPSRPQTAQNAAAQESASAAAATDQPADIAEVNELLAAASIAASEIDDAVAADRLQSSAAVLISASNWMMRAWEMGNEAEYRALTAPEFRMVSFLATCATLLQVLLPVYGLFAYFSLRCSGPLSETVTCDPFLPRLFPRTAWMCLASTTSGRSVRA